MFKEIKTNKGNIKGKVNNDIASFLGIKYATSKRWAYPIMNEDWDNNHNAFEYGDCCYQKRSFVDESIIKPFYYNEFRKGLNYSYSEDCLYLNVFTPSDSNENSSLPVIVYIHGGSFRSGCANELCFMDPIWPSFGVIGVTINYRVGLLGFACFKEAEDESGFCGNYGLADQIMALKWVRENIKYFGGDPNNITIMGQSAGAMSVQALVFSPVAEGLFHKAVMISGGGITKSMTLKPSSSKMKLFAKLYEETGCKSFQELRELDVNVLFSKYYELEAKDKNMNMINIPYIDGKYLVDSQFNRIDKLNNIPYLIGTTEEDLLSYVLFNMSKDWCLLQDKLNHVPSYLWMFSRALPGDDSKSFHCADMWYWFGSLSNSWRPFTKEDYDLMDTMVIYLTNFAKYGNPNSKNKPIWLPINKNQKKAMVLDVNNVEMKKINTFKLLVHMLTKRPVGF